MSEFEELNFMILIPAQLYSLEFFQEVQINETRGISLYGSHPNLKSRPGILHGAEGDLAGISSAQPSPGLILQPLCFVIPATMSAQAQDN